MQRHPNIVNIDELDWESGGNGDRFVYRHKSLTPLVGAQMLGCSLYRVAAGQTAFPHHRHHANDEVIYVLEGKAVYRLNQDWVEVEAGDFMWLRAFCPQACYAGGPGRFRYLLYKDVNRHMPLRLR